MIKKKWSLIVLVLLMFALSSTAEEKAWFDMENCEMCANFVPLMPTMTCEQHNISNGTMMIAFLEPDQMEDYTRANAACRALGEKIMNGYEAKMCGSCEALGTLIAKGIQMEEVMLQSGGVQLITSDDEAVVAELHAWADRNEAEIAKLMESGELE